MTLRELISDIAGGELSGKDAIIRGIAYDSRKTQPGDLFVAVQGQRSDGAQFALDAVRRGAVAVLCHANVELPSHISTIRVSNVRRAMAEAAWSIFDHPERKLRLAAITGTNGKTTTTSLLQQLLEHSGCKAGTVGTLGVNFRGTADSGARTTPEAVDIAKSLSEMHAAGVTHVVMEATSIGIELDRVWGLPFELAIFTNLTRDHLDFHGSEEHYLASKLRLFSERLPSDHCIINSDDPGASSFMKAAAGKVLTYGIDSGAVRAGDIRMTVKGGSFSVKWPDGELPVTSPLLGRFNIYNSLAALAAGWRWGLAPQEMVRAFATMKAARGRAEVVASNAPFSVIVDYAHTPDALEKILTTMRELRPTKLIVVFGAGGDRDRGKRPLMGRIAGQLADQVVVTSDNPRSENPQAIMNEIIAGIAGGATYKSVVDRREAIGDAIKSAKSGAAIVIAGKGHETYQEIGGQIIDFDDTEIVRGFLREMGYTS